VNPATSTLSFWLTDRFLLPWLAVAAALAGGGVLLLRSALPGRARPLAWVAGMAVPAFLAVAGFRSADHSRDYLGFDYARNVLDGCRGARVVFGEGLTQAFPLLDAAWVEGSSPPFVVTVPFLSTEGGWRRLARRLPEAGEPAVRTEPIASRTPALADRLLKEGPVRHLTACFDPGLKGRLEWRGVASAVLPPGGKPRSPSREEVGRALGRMRLRGLWSRFPAKDEAPWTVLDAYGVAASAAADRAVRDGSPGEAVMEWDWALKVPGRSYRVVLLTASGYALMTMGRPAEAEDRFREAASMEPLNPAPWAGLAAACAAQGRRESALMYARWTLRWQPGHPGAMRLVARLGG
jgi:hypothetical protein